ncbi:trans-aconitate 2-methyltransferase [Amycolatopsis sp. EV170708-02-1]|uniref:class I SAM-dependent methyltransferase n=1 Tax=Amycolatopsis sp. EV170708-02-1 TaxID=2919322 RepID=UPI001F0C998F|nr:class I SAM-dependent methyltransferase [Amycolatopsis sp. EV170708-02-1]UMP07073.1 class I SAM-dependent methyltransferase [Amycolatopsis sp. EV170708-02-1]
MNLAAHNTAYRRPDLYDALTRDSTTATTCQHLIDQHGTAPSASILDLGCGTARDLAQLATSHHCVGVDLQPALIDHARQRYPDLELHVGDIRTVRLNRTFDVITCLGNTLAYLHRNNDIQAAFTTFAAHAHPGTLLIIVTQIAPTTTTTPTRSRVDAAGLHADVTTEHSWDARTQISTVHRTWQLDNGTTEHDLLHRRVLFPRELELYATLAGFTPQALFTNAQDRTGPLTGSTAHFVAKYDPA